MCLDRLGMNTSLSVRITLSKVPIPVTLTRDLQFFLRLELMRPNKRTVEIYSMHDRSPDGKEKRGLWKTKEESILSLSTAV